MTPKHTCNKQNKNRVSKVVKHYFSTSMVFTKYFLILIQDQQPKFLFLGYSKVLRYTFSRCADLGDTRFWIGYKSIFGFTYTFAKNPRKICISRKFWTFWDLTVYWTCKKIMEPFSEPNSQTQKTFFHLNTIFDFQLNYLK